MLLADKPHQRSRRRHEVRRRTAIVADVIRLTPRMRRIRFVVDEMDGFASDAHDDHVRLFFPLAQPTAAGEACRRDYTVRKVDLATKSVTIDFVLHRTGPATTWASRALPGDTLEIAGPRGSEIVADDFAWYVLVGDETALPAIGRRVEELRAGVPVATFILVDTPAEHQTFATAAIWMPHWIMRRAGHLDDGALLRHALAAYETPPGDGYVWIAAEAEAARTVRGFVSDAWGHPDEWTKSSGYWAREDLRDVDAVEGATGPGQARGRVP